MALHPGERKRHFPEEAPVAWDPIRRALEENEDWYRDLVEHSQDLLCVHDLKGRFLSVNPVPARLLGYSVNEVLQKPMREFVDPQFREQFDAYMREIERHGVARGLLAVLTRSGEQRIWEYHNTLRTEGVDAPIVRGIAHDVTDRVRAEKALRATNERLLKTTQEQEQTLRGLTLFRTLLDQSNDAIKVVDPESLRILDVNERACLDLGYNREEMLSMTVRDIDPNVDEDLIARIMARLRESGFAIFERTHRRKDGTTFPVEVNLRMAQLDRKYLVTISRDITERKRAETRLREFERVVEHLEDMILVVNREYRYVLVNRAFLRYRGMTQEQVIGRLVGEVMNPEMFVTVVKEKLDECFRGKVVHYELRQEYPAIGERDLSITYLPVEGANGIDRAACIFRDITDRKRAEEASQASEARERARAKELETLLDALPIPVMLAHDAQCRHMTANRMGREYLRLKPGANASMSGPADERPRLRFLRDGVEIPPDQLPMQRAAATGRPVYDVPVTAVFEDGTERHEVSNAVPLLDEDGKVRGAIGTAMDVTERKRAEEGLRASEERLRLAQEVAKIGVFERNFQNGESTWSRETEAMFGLAPGEFPRSIEAFLNLVQVEDRPSVARLVEQSMQSGDAGGEWRVVWPDGTVHWIAGRWRVFKDELGRPTRIVGMDFDITERKRAEEALRESEEQFRAVYERSPVGISLVDTRTGRFLQVNPKYCEITGRSEEELLRTDVSSITHPDDVRRDSEYRCQLAEEKLANFEREKRYLRPDGSVRWVRIRVVPMWGKGETHRWHMGLAEDITERRQFEQSLQDSEERYRSVVSAMAEGALLRDASGRILACNRSFEEMMGVTSEQMVGTTAADWEHRTIHEDGSPFPGGDHPAIMALRTGRPQSNIRMGFRRQDEVLTWLSINAQPIFRSGESKPHAVVTTFADITKQKQAEEAIAALEQQVHVESSESFFASMAVQLAKCLEADCTIIGELIEGEEAKVKTIGVCGQGAIAENFTYDLADTPSEAVMRQGTCSYVAGVSELFPKDPWLKQMKMEGYAGAPLRNSQGRVVGVMLALYTRPLANPKFAEMILQLFSTRTAGQIERKHTEEALRKSEAELRQAQRIGRMGSWYRDLATDTFIFSEQFYRLLGMDPKDQAMQFADIERFLTPESRQRIIQANEKLLSTGERDEFEVEFRCPNGTSGWAVLHREAVRDKAGSIIGIRGIALDITERKQSEEALRQSDERFRVALKNSPISVFNQGRDLRYTWMYNAQVPGPSGHLGKTPIEFFGPEEGKGITEIRQRVLDTGVGVRHEVQVTENGKKHYFDTTIEPVLDATGAVIGLTGASTDVTELRETAEALRDAKKKLTEEKLYLEQEIDTELGFGEIVGRSKALQAVMENVGKVATSNATVLLLGETGSGKELVARAIHRLSLRANNSFIKMNCAAIPSGLLESELFGNEKGAFTGAVSKKIGRLELADKGTLFLDEIGEISLALQPKLLRVLQDQEFERLGGTQTLKVDFRLIAATNRDLADLVREMEFRSDLYYRLNVFPIMVPPLRDRRDDIPILVEHFVQKCARRMKKTITSIPKKTMDTLTGWEWPGNVRELENFIERSVILTHGSVLVAPLAEMRPLSTEQEESSEQTLEAAEREHIQRALRESHGQIGGARGAAVRLGLKRTTLQSKLKQLGINPKTGRTEH